MPEIELSVDQKYALSKISFKTYCLHPAEAIKFAGNYKQPGIFGKIENPVAVIVRHMFFGKPVLIHAEENWGYKEVTKAINLIIRCPGFSKTSSQKRKDNKKLMAMQSVA